MKRQGLKLWPSTKFCFPHEVNPTEQSSLIYAFFQTEGYLKFKD